MRVTSNLINLSIIIILSFGVNPAFGTGIAAKPQQPRPVTSDVESVRHMISQIVHVNQRYKDRFHSIISHTTLEKQTPHATVVMCSDSRVDSDIISDSPTGELFVVRDIGNQVKTAYGSVQYGVEELHTHMLIIVGHSQCGAVKAAMTDYSKESPLIQAELKTLDVNLKDTLNHNLVHNVHSQVKSAADTFKSKIADGELIILGMIYDMHNDFKYGHGQLILVNINNETDPRSLAQNEYLTNVSNLVILGLAKPETS